MEKGVAEREEGKRVGRERWKREREEGKGRERGRGRTSPTLMASFNLNCFLRGPISNTSTLGVRASTYELEYGQQHSVHNRGDTVSSNTPHYESILTLCTEYTFLSRESLPNNHRKEFLMIQEGKYTIHLSCGTRVYPTPLCARCILILIYSCFLFSRL